jgi:NTE family protein
LNSDIIFPECQRALILQRGAGTGCIEKKKNCNNHELLFDIIAGTSMGAMNAAVLVSNVVNRKKKWKESIEELEKFWTDEKDGLSSNPDISKWWQNDDNSQNKAYASDEALRKYYSVREYFTHGTPRVCILLLPDLI